MHENVCYKKPFLKEVILRLDFATKIEGISRTLPQKIAAAALGKFPIFEPQKAQMQEVTFSGGSLQTKTEDLMQWVYHGKNRDKALIITPEQLTITNKKYDTFELFNEDFLHVSKALFESQKDLAVARFGLRYINVIEIPGDDPLSWSDYINEEMLGIIDMHKDAASLTRAFHIVEFNYDGQHIKFQFGIANPDYPAPIRRRQFILDIDSSFTIGALTEEDVTRCVYKSHEKIQALFEESITQQTRSFMGQVAET